MLDLLSPQLFNILGDLRLQLLPQLLISRRNHLLRLHLVRERVPAAALPASREDVLGGLGGSVGLRVAILGFCERGVRVGVGGLLLLLGGAADCELYRRPRKHLILVTRLVSLHGPRRRVRPGNITSHECFMRVPGRDLEFLIFQELRELK